MNCKPGDLAIFVRSLAGNDGRIVRCIRLATRDDLLDFGLCPKDGVWIIDGLANIVFSSGRIIRAPFAGDSCLRPIRDQDGEDETLTWAGKPEGVTA